MDQFEPNIPALHGIDAEGKEYELDLTSPFDAPSPGGESGVGSGIAPSYPGLPDEFLSPAEQERRRKAEFQQYLANRALNREIHQGIPTETTKRFIATKKRLKAHKGTRAQIEQSAQHAARARTSATRQAAAHTLSRIVPPSSRKSTREQERQDWFARASMPYAPAVSVSVRTPRQLLRLPRWMTRMATPFGVIVGGSLLFALTVLGGRTHAHRREQRLYRQSLQPPPAYDAPPLPPNVHTAGATVPKDTPPPMPWWVTLLTGGSTTEEIQALAMSRGRRRRELREQQAQTPPTPTRTYHPQNPAYASPPKPPSYGPTASLPSPPPRKSIPAYTNTIADAQPDFSDLPETWVEAQSYGYGWEEWQEANQERRRERKRATDRARRARQRAERDAMTYW